MALTPQQILAAMMGGPVSQPQQPLNQLGLTGQILGGGIAPAQTSTPLQRAGGVTTQPARAQPAGDLTSNILFGGSGNWGGGSDQNWGTQPAGWSAPAAPSQLAQAMGSPSQLAQAMGSPSQLAQAMGSPSQLARGMPDWSSLFSTQNMGQAMPSMGGLFGGNNNLSSILASLFGQTSMGSRPSTQPVSRITTGAIPLSLLRSGLSPR